VQYSIRRELRWKEEKNQIFFGLWVVGQQAFFWWDCLEIDQNDPSVSSRPGWNTTSNDLWERANRRNGHDDHSQVDSSSTLTSSSEHCIEELYGAANLLPNRVSIDSTGSNSSNSNL
jgi:hypothetical protein